MKILETRVYRGPNLYALWPVIRLRVDLGELEEHPTVELPGFVERLLERLPTLAEHTCSYGEPGGFVRRMTEDEGTWLGHVLEHVAIELQCLAGTPVTYGKTRGTGLPRGQYHVVYSYREEAVGLAAGEVALRLVHHLLPPEREAHDPEPVDLTAEIERLSRLAHASALGPSTAALVRAAEDRDIPWMRLDEGSLVQLGYGRYQRRIQASVTSETRLTAVEMAGDKRLTNSVLGSLGLPVPRQEIAQTVEEAIDAARRIGFPVIVKPSDGNQGRGVSLALRTPEEVPAAFEAARERSPRVVVERWVTGRDYRILVVGGRVVAVAERVPGHVVGDGRSTVAELVELANRDPRRGIGHEKPLTRLALDEAALGMLERQGLAPGAVPEAGRFVALRSACNLSTGGTSIDRTDEIHPDNRRMAERAVKAIGLDVGGVDFITPDVAESHLETGGAIVEVNAGPGLRMHLAPSEGAPRDVAGPIIDMLFPRGTPSRIPIAAITGTNGKTTTTRMVGHLMQLAGYTVGMTTTDGVYVDGALTARGDMTGPWSSQLVLRDPTVDAAVLETARGGLLRSGLAFRKANVGAVLNVASDHLGLGGIDSLDDLARLKQIVVEVARDYCVLNADDRRVARMAHASPGDPIFVTMDPKSTLVRRHLWAGGKAVVFEGGSLVLYGGEGGGSGLAIVAAADVPATLGGQALHNVQNAMFAAAIAHGLGVGIVHIRQGLKTFACGFDKAPGRLNLYEGYPFKVLLDYAHNPAAMEAIVRTVRALPVAGRRIGVLAAPGDRRDEDVRALGRAAARAFDLVLLREDGDLRGRRPGETAALLCDGLLAGGHPPAAIAPGVEEECQGVRRALGLARPGDLVAVFAEDVEAVWKEILAFGERPEEPSPAPVDWAAPEVVHTYG